MATLASDFYPEVILREAGGLAAHVYRCFGTRGEYFTTTFETTFVYEGKTYTTDLMRHGNLMPLALLARRSFDAIERLPKGINHGCPPH